MPRKPRYYLAGVPCHVISRGNNSNACFFENEDYQFYLECLSSACRRYAVSLHAYVLMTNHVHLLMTPTDREGISRVMQSIGRRYVQFVNVKYRKSGTLWEGRHKASLVDAERYLLVCYRYIEMNPVRANMVSKPDQYRWSSFHENSGIMPLKRVTPHDVYQRLGIDTSSRHNTYLDLFKTELRNDDTVISTVSWAAQFSMPLGDSRFCEQIENAVGRKLGYSRRGRPTATKKAK
ncbi:MAG: transposase [Arenicella sp.]|nr:transposase [Arenicella sp.]